MQVVMNKCVLLNPEKKFDADPPCLLRKTQKCTLKSEKWCHRAKGLATLITSYKLLTGYKSISNFRKPWFPKAWNWLHPVNSRLTDNSSRLAFGSVTSFFGIKGAFSSKMTRRICDKFFFRV